MPRLSLPVLSDGLDPGTQPQTRADCLPGGANGTRPCGWSCCRHSLTAEGVPGLCVLDVVDESGPQSLDAIGQMLQVSRERIRQIEAHTLVKVRRRAASRPSLAGYADLAQLPAEVRHEVRVPGRR